MKKEAERFSTLDIYLSAFLRLSGLPTHLEDLNGKIAFLFPSSSDLYRLLSNFNANTNVPVADYVTAIKSLRGQMLSLKAELLTRKGSRGE